jgi:hypothetical protein
MVGTVSLAEAFTAICLWWLRASVNITTLFFTVHIISSDQPSTITIEFSDAAAVLIALLSF